MAPQAVVVGELAASEEVEVELTAVVYGRSRNPHAIYISATADNVLHRRNKVVQIKFSGGYIVRALADGANVGRQSSVLQQEEPEIPTGWIPTYQPPVPNIFNGSLTNSIALLTPPGPNGLTPNLTLTYNSGINTYIKLIDMNARWYLPNTNRFISADTIVPDPKNPQSYNRYSYVNNNPVNSTDPTGHCSQYGGENGDVQELTVCLEAWNALVHYYGHVTKWGQEAPYPNEYTSILLETATTGELVSLLNSYGVDYTLPSKTSGSDIWVPKFDAIGIGISANGDMISVFVKHKQRHQIA